LENIVAFANVVTSLDTLVVFKLLLFHGHKSITVR
jgi:hypothetical protein